MALAQSWIALVGIALACARAGLALGTTTRGRLFAAVAFVLVLVPVAGIPLAGYVRGVAGDLSVTTLVVLAAGFAGGVSPRERHALSALILAGAVFLYPMALGLLPFDPYRLGYDPALLLAAAFIVALLAWWWRCYIVLLCILAAVSTHALGVLESANLWDYLLDPWIALASIYDLRSWRRKA